MEQTREGLRCIALASHSQPTGYMLQRKMGQIRGSHMKKIRAGERGGKGMFRDLQLLLYSSIAICLRALIIPWILLAKIYKQLSRFTSD